LDALKPDSQILIYQNPDGIIKIDVLLEEETVWLTQAHMAELFGKGRTTITEHIRNIFKEGELAEKLVCRDFRHTTQHGAIEGKTQTKVVKYYNLDVIISVGYRVKSHQGTQFRIWATKRLKEYIVKGFSLNDERFKTGSSMNYFNELQDRLREIRLSERFFYQKIKDIYTTSIDYDTKDEITVEFFKIVQNKLLWAISSQTAAELIYRRADASLPLMGMISYDKENAGKIKKSDVSIAKNYLNEAEIKLLGLLVEQYLAFAETMAQQHTPMYMKDWITRLDNILQLNGREILTHAGKISHQVALEKSNLELEKYKEDQKRLSLESSLKELENDIKQIEKKSGKDLQKEKSSFEEMGINFEEKAFYDILKAVAEKHEFEYPHEKLITLSQAVKKVVDDKAKYTDWSQRDDIKAELKVDLILILADHGYPPVPKDEVFKEIFEQAENFKKYRGE
jgi:hypothetical protein